MLIQALSDYYDMLASAEMVLPEGYSKVNIHYIISLTEEGIVEELIDCQAKEVVPAGKNKTKIRKVPVDMVMPQRTEKPGIDANCVEHRPVYLFGLNLEKNEESGEYELTPEDRTGKARKSHAVFVQTNMALVENLDTPVVNAFRKFLVRWKPEDETQNPILKGIGKDYSKAGFVFCLSGSPDQLLHEDRELRKRWEKLHEEQSADESEAVWGQCGVTGEKAPIARIHSKIKGVYGGLSTGSVLIGFNNASENSYGNGQSYNSNISERTMKKYTEALNYLLSSGKHKVMLDEMTVVFWAMSKSDAEEDLFMKMLFGSSDKMDAKETDAMLKKLMDAGRMGKVTVRDLESQGNIEENVDFYMIGLKPNSSRLSLKFLFRKRYADILWNIARFQNDLQISKEFRPVSLPRLRMELTSPQNSNEKVNPALLSGLLEAVVYGRRYPAALLETMVRRVKTDSGKINRVRAGIIKAYINRDSKKEELKVALDLKNKEPAYLCGRLFAVLEKLQQEASGSLNRTIKDTYFASASAKPSLVFPKLIQLANYHERKVKYSRFFEEQICEIIGLLEGKFPDTLRLKDQGVFIVGYYHQYQDLFEKRDKNKNKNENSNENKNENKNEKMEEE